MARSRRTCGIGGRRKRIEGAGHRDEHNVREGGRHRHPEHVRQPIQHDSAGGDLLRLELQHHLLKVKTNNMLI